MYKELLNSLIEPIVMVNTEHVTVYMNKAAINKFENRGGKQLIGKSIFDCHNENSCNMIREIFAKMQSGLQEQMITDDDKKRVFMRAVRDENDILIGYYERYEYK